MRLINSSLSATILLMVPACIHRGGPPSPVPFDTREVALVRGGAAEIPLDLVENVLPEEERLLRTPSLPVDPNDPDLPILLLRMRSTLDAQQGVGIAAPQVGVLRRVIWVQRQDLPESPFQAYLNPGILAIGAEAERGWEGCLSVPAGYGEVDRPLAITLRWQNPDGALHTEEVSGWTARIFQHEIDHLDGILFVDRMVTETLVDKETFRARRAAEKKVREESDSGESAP